MGKELEKKINLNKYQVRKTFNKDGSISYERYDSENDIWVEIHEDVYNWIVKFVKYVKELSK